MKSPADEPACLGVCSVDQSGKCSACGYKHEEAPRGTMTKDATGQRPENKWDNVFSRCG